MSRVCSVCGKSKMAGHQVSHSNIKTNKTYSANVQKVAVADENGKVEKKVTGYHTKNQITELMNEYLK